MSVNLFEGFPLHPRRGSVLRVLIIARISTVHQDPRSLADQIALCERYVRSRYSGPDEFFHIQSQGSGEVLDRRELAEAEARVEAGEFDLVVVEDLGRICRRNRAVDFCELCEDSATRLIAINDSIDTARDDWRVHAFFATFRHESANKDTSKRIRRTMRNRFTQGGVVQTLPYGYVKPPGAKSDADVFRDPEAEPIVDGIFTHLEQGASYCEVADWLNAQNVPTGRWARSRRWTNTLVRQLVHNPILKGWRRRNERVSQRVNRSGRRKSVKAPAAERLYRVVPRLAFVTETRFDRLIATLTARHAAFARGRKSGTPDGRVGVSRKRTVWPGQHLRCGLCGRLMYWGGHGRAGHMMCAGAREYTCWNGATFDGCVAGRRLAAAVLAAAERLPAYDAAFVTRVTAAVIAKKSERAAALGRIEREIEHADRELVNLLDAVATNRLSSALNQRLQETEDRKARLIGERDERLARPDDVPDLPPVEEIKARTRAAVAPLAFDDPSFGRTMARLVPRMVVLPYQPLDGGHVVLRAHLTVNFAMLLGPAGDAVGPVVTVETTADLFDPPQRIAHRERIAALRSAGRTERAVAADLGLTVTAAQKAMTLHRRLRAAGVSDPYVLVTAPSPGDVKACRHRHARYQFQPLAGYPAWPTSEAA